jgi:hypothetical protein
MISEKRRELDKINGDIVNDTHSDEFKQFHPNKRKRKRESWGDLTMAQKMRSVRDGTFGDYEGSESLYKAPILDNNENAWEEYEKPNRTSMTERRFRPGDGEDGDPPDIMEEARHVSVSRGHIVDNVRIRLRQILNIMNNTPRYTSSSRSHTDPLLTNPELGVRVKTQFDAIYRELMSQEGEGPFREWIDEAIGILEELINNWETSTDEDFRQACVQLFSLMSQLEAVLQNRSSHLSANM